MAVPSALGILYLLLLLQVKHAVIDGPLQTRWMLAGKGVNGAAPGFAHAGAHAAGTLVALSLFGGPFGAGVVLAALDGFVHYHTDYFKEAAVRRRGWTTKNTEFWWIMAADQLTHHLTYIAVAALVVVWAAH